MHPENRVRPLPYAISMWHTVFHVLRTARIKRWFSRRGRAVGALVVCLMLLSGRDVGGQENVAARRALFGDVALELRTPDRGSLAIGVADAHRAITLDVRATDARRWSDVAARLIANAARERLLAARARRSAKKTKTVKTAPDSAREMSRGAMANDRVVLEEPGVGAGSLLLARADSAGIARWLLYVADADLAEIRQLLDDDEARTLVRIVRSAAIAAAPAPLRKPKKKRAATAPKATAKPKASPTGGTPRRPA